MKCLKLFLTLSIAVLVYSSVAWSQDFYPEDNGLAQYHKAPRYRESESHPIRIVGYLLHPVGWILREVVFRPFSWFASSEEEVSSVMGFREPYDFRYSSCFDFNAENPECNKIPPYNYDK